MSQTEHLPAPPTEDTPTKPKLYTRKWVQLAIVAVVGLSMGNAIGSGDADTSRQEARAAERAAKAAEERADAAEARAREAGVATAEAEARADDAEAAARDSLEEARRQLEDEFAGREAAVADREAAVGQAEARQAMTTFADGIHVVGVDILPGRYRATPSGTCYWARLSGFSGELSDVIANELTDATTMVQVRESDAAFESTGCGTWTLAE